MNNSSICYIVPTLNESKHIANTINSIKKAVQYHFHYSIIVVDNGSSDNTKKIAEENGALVFEKPNCTIASNRNCGFRKTNADILVFLDADVYLESCWGKEFQTTIELLRDHPLTVTGSIVGIKNDKNLIEKCWFKPRLKEQNIKYINSGHIIVSRELFQIVGGFDGAMVTGEDYDFCMRAKKIGARIINNPKLRVVHQGYPQNIPQFFRRERWHGRGDFLSLRNIVSSKPALIVVCQLLLLISSIAVTFFTSNILFLFFFIIFFMSVCFLAAVIRCGLKKIDLFPCTLLYSVYFVARSFALIDVVLGHAYRKIEGDKKII